MIVQNTSFKGYVKCNINLTGFIYLYFSMIPTKMYITNTIFRYHQKLNKHSFPSRTPCIKVEN